MNGYSMSPDSSTSPRAYVQTGIPQSFTIDSFRIDSSELSGNHKKALDNLAKLVTDTHQTPQPVLEIVVVGHADKSGSFTYNHYLGLKRACSVASYLLYVLHRKYSKQLIYPVPVTLNTEGKLTQNSNADAKNRRVEIWLRAEAPRPQTPSYPPYGPPQTYPAVRPPQRRASQGETLLDEILSAT